MARVVVVQWQQWQRNGSAGSGKVGGAAGGVLPVWVDIGASGGGNNSGSDSGHEHGGH